MEKRILINITNQILENITQKSKLNYSLLGGDLGKVLFLYNAYNRGFCQLEQADEVLSKVVNSLRKQPIITTYCNGLAGFGIALLYLQREGYVDGASESIQVFDTLLSHQMFKWVDENLDFLHGAIGIGMYFNQKASFDIKSAQIVRELINLLISSNKSEDNEEISYWFFPNRLNKLSQNLSMSHGISSVVMFLARAYNTLTSTEDRNLCMSLLTKTGNYICMNLVNPKTIGSYTPMLPNGGKSRLGWCYGDIGTSIALRSIGEITC